MLIELPAHVLELSGPEAVSFAQAQFSSDLRALETGQWQWSAWLSALGRVRCWFALLRVADERLLLWLRGDGHSALRAELARFVFRSKVTVQVPHVSVYGADAAGALAAGAEVPGENRLTHHDGVTALQLPDAARYVLISQSPITQSPTTDAPLDTSADAAARARWQHDDIHAGLPQLEAALQDQLLPQWLALDRLGVVNVGKGCYPGQEVMARLHFKGGNKRGLYHIAFSAPALPPAGTVLRTTDAEAGVIVQSAWTTGGNAEALAVFADAAVTRVPHHVHAQPLGDIQVVSRFG